MLFSMYRREQPLHWIAHHSSAAYFVNHSISFSSLDSLFFSTVFVLAPDNGKRRIFFCVCIREKSLLLHRHYVDSNDVWFLIFCFFIFHLPLLVFLFLFFYYSWHQPEVGQYGTDCHAVLNVPARATIALNSAPQLSCLFCKPFHFFFQFGFSFFFNGFCFSSW